MTSDDFRAWRKQIGLTQQGAAHALGTNARTIAYYEAGERDGKPFEIPRYIYLACAQITMERAESSNAPIR